MAGCWSQVWAELPTERKRAVLLDAYAGETDQAQEALARAGRDIVHLRDAVARCSVRTRGMWRSARSAVRKVRMKCRTLVIHFLAPDRV